MAVFIPITRGAAAINAATSSLSPSNFWTDGDHFSSYVMHTVIFLSCFLGERYRVYVRKYGIQQAIMCKLYHEEIYVNSFGMLK